MDMEDFILPPPPLFLFMKYLELNHALVHYRKLTFTLQFTELKELKLLNCL